MFTVGGNRSRVLETVKFHKSRDEDASRKNKVEKEFKEPRKMDEQSKP